MVKIEQILPKTLVHLLFATRGGTENHEVTRALTNARIKDARKTYVKTNGRDKATSPGSLKRAHFIVNLPHRPKRISE